MDDFSHYKKIHCIGIGGIGMSAIAEILIDRGYNVSGSDMRESDSTDKLISMGAKVALGHMAKNVKEDIDLVIYTAAIADDNPELLKAKSLGIKLLTRAEALGMLMSEYNTSIAISGTHGKTTTTSMVSLILNNAKKDPTILVGGNLSDINGNLKIGKSEYFVTEACEYMDSFLSLRPKVELILNIDSDHLDYFDDIEHIAKSFRAFAELVPKDGLVIGYDANPFVKAALKNVSNVVTFGFSRGSDYVAEDIEFDHQGLPSFKICNGENVVANVKLKIPGEHNIQNALAAAACTHTLGVDGSDIENTLNEFSGINRRFDIVGMIGGSVKLVDDYAHHPTEIEATLDAAKKMKHNRLWCLFQPHTYTRTKALFNDFAPALSKADIIVMNEIYAAREININKLSAKSIVEDIKKRFPEKEVYFFEDMEDMAGFVYENLKINDLVITMGAGDIFKAGELLMEYDRELF